MTQVFISYSRRDLAFVEQLAADLQAAGLDVWYDLSNLEGGSRWSREIEKAIQDSQYVLVILSPESVASKWVEEEFLYASELGKKIIPLFYKQCALPFGYRTLHFIDIQGSKYKQKFNEILRALDVKPTALRKLQMHQKAESVPEKPIKKEETPKPKMARTQRKLNLQTIMIIIGLVGLILVAVFGLPPLFNQPEYTPMPKYTPTSPLARTPTVRSTFTEIITPTITPLPIETMITPTNDPFAATPTGISCDDAKWVADVTVPDGTEMMPGQDFVKTWKVRNTGSCTWGVGYIVIFAYGEKMNGVAEPLSSSVSPNEDVEISVRFKAPNAPGQYSSAWRMPATDHLVKFLPCSLSLGRDTCDIRKIYHLGRELTHKL